MAPCAWSISVLRCVPMSEVLTDPSRAGSAAPQYVPGRGMGRRLAVRFAIADLIHDRFLSVMGIVLLAALIAPPVMLHTLRVGLVETWAQDLAQDIRNREVVIVGENRIAEADFGEIASWPQTGFVVPEPSFFVSTQRTRKAEARGGAIELNLRTTAPGDPVMDGVIEAPTDRFEVVLSARAAENLDVVVGERVAMILARTPTDANPMRQTVELSVVGVLPDRRWSGVNGFVTPATLLGFREWLTFESDDPTAVPPPETVSWQSMRIYAPEVAQAVALRDRLESAGYDTRLMTDQVDRIQKLETGLRQIFGIVLVLSASAFLITAFLLQWLSVLRKKRDFALMSVIGMTRRDLAVFPAFQGGVLTTLACLISLCFVVAMQGPVETIVQGYLTTPSQVQSPQPLPLAFGFAVAIALGALAGVAAIRVLRDDVLTHALRGD